MTSSLVAAEGFDASELLSPRQIHELSEGAVPLRILSGHPKYSLTNYQRPGPVCSAYIDSNGPIDCIMGPGGSGKTVGSIFKIFRFTITHMPVCRDGRIRVKGTIVNYNYRALYRTFLASWFMWFPTSTYPEFFGGQDRPAIHKMRFSTVRLINGVAREIPVDAQFDFFAVQDVDYEFQFKSYETSLGLATEADLIAPEVIPFFYSRTARYPRRALLPDGVDLPRMMCADFNPPEPDHPLLAACLRGSFNEAFDPGKEARSINFWRQPGGLSDNAENRFGKPRTAYEEEARILTVDQKRRMVDGLPGRVKDGLPVYDEEWSHEDFVAQQPLAIIDNLPLDAGFDQGLSPACVIGQLTPEGQLRIYRECLPGHGVGVDRFLELLLPLFGEEVFRGQPPGLYTSDPAGFYGADKVAGQAAWAEILGRGLGHPVYPAPTNEWAPRRTALAAQMKVETRGGQRFPKLIIDPSCKNLIKALSTGFKYRKHANGNFDTFPNKSTTLADIADAAIYLILGRVGLAGVIATASRAGRPVNVVPLARPVGRPGDFDVWKV